MLWFEWRIDEKQEEQSNGNGNRMTNEQWTKIPENRWLYVYSCIFISGWEEKMNRLRSKGGTCNTSETCGLYVRKNLDESMKRVRLVVIGMSCVSVCMNKECQWLMNWTANGLWFQEYVCVGKKTTGNELTRSGESGEGGGKRRQNI